MQIIYIYIDPYMAFTLFDLDRQETYTLCTAFHRTIPYRNNVNLILDACTDKVCMICRLVDITTNRGSNK